MSRRVQQVDIQDSDIEQLPSDLPGLDDVVDRRREARARLREEGLYDPNVVSELTGRFFDPAEDLAQQQFKRDADIITIAERFHLTGEMPVARSLAEYGDFSESVDFHTALNELARGQEAFDSLPVRIRARFDNDPGKLWEFLHSDEDNLREAVELGILDRRALPVEASGVPSGGDSAVAGGTGTPA